MKKINIVFSCAVSASLLVACAAESTAPVQSSRLKVATAKPVEQVSQTPPATLSISIDKPTELISCADVADKAYRQSILDAVNEVRKTARSCGGQFFQAATPLTWNDHLTQSAQEQANDMANAHITAQPEWIFGSVLK